MRNKMFILVFLAMFFANVVPSFATSVEQQNVEVFSDIPSDTPEYFAQRYEHLLGLKGDKQLHQLAEQLNNLARERDKLAPQQTKLNRNIIELKERLGKTQDDKDRREIEKDIAKNSQELAKVQIKLDKLAPKITALKKQVEPLIDKFWLDRDTDPTTPENEFKNEIDERIEDIANERLFSTPGTTGLLFHSNGGFRGDMANVYLLHGEPDAMDVIEGHSFVPLMLWIYVNPENGNILYAFLFYQKKGLGSFGLFSQYSHQMDQCGALYEVAANRMYNYTGGGMQACPEDLYQVYNDIYRSSGKGGIIDGYIFAWALFNFSQDGSNLQGEALSPPKQASEIAKQSNARVVGEAPKLVGTAGTDYILASCESCNSMIPGELQLGKEFALSVRRSDIDWRVVGEKAEVELKVRVVIESVGNKMPPLVFEKKAPFTDKKDLIISDPASRIFITLLTTGEVTQISAGTYRISVYVKNITSSLMTQKYNAWSKDFVK